MAKEEKLRSEIEEKYKWDLSSIYKSLDDFNADVKTAEELIEEIVSYKGKITSDSKTLYEFLRLDEKLGNVIDSLYVYASCLKDEDISNKENQALYNKVLNLYSYYGEKTSFIMPEFMETSYDVIKDYINNNDDLKEFSFDLENIYRYQKYTLTPKEEKLLSSISDLQNKYKNNFSIATNSILDYGYIKDEDGNDVKLTNGNLVVYSRSKDRDVRKASFYARYNALEKLANLISTDYEGTVKADSIIAKTRGYNSNLHMHLYDDGVSEEAYYNLLKVADKNIDVLHKYFKMIKNVLKIDDFKIYDLAAPLTIESNKKYSVEDARKLITTALSVYGDEYVTMLNRAFDEKWIDFYPNKGKRNGYYETSTTAAHPIVLANYTDDYISVSSLAHELGHAMHSCYSNKNNPSHLAEYTIFVAEVASLTNEILLANYIINNSDDKNEKLVAIENILSIFASNFFGTLSEGSIFEEEVHRRVFNGDSLTESDFNEIYKKVRYNYYGPDVDKDDVVKYGWVRISHFYNPFYYYKYSIGISCACYVAKQILNNNNEYLNKYLNYLKLGGSMMPLDELKQIDIDLSSDKVIEEGIKYFDELIDKFTEIYND